MIFFTVKVAVCLLKKKLKALVYNKNYISNSHMSRQCYIYQNLSPQQVVKEIVKFVMFVT